MACVNTMTRRTLSFATLMACLAIADIGAGEGVPSARLLFIGNSLTTTNDLPAMVVAIAAQSGLQGRVTTRTVAFPDYGLEEHWKDGRAVRAIRAGNWTHVVLQQGPSSLPQSQVLLRHYTKAFDREIRRTAARTALYSVWPPRARAAAFDAVTASYANAAADVGGLLVPAGEAWRAAWRRDAALPLYGADGFHPSPMGTYLAALVCFERLTGRSAVGLPNPSSSRDGSLRDVRIDPAQLTLLQEAAAEAIAR